MKAVVVYESYFGNTREIAEAVADGLSTQLPVEVHEVTVLPAVQLADEDLIVVGGPTHAFSLSRPATREEALKHGAPFGSRPLGLREWLSKLPASTGTQRFASFDTRVGSARHFPGSAARKAARLLRALGYTVAGRESFLVAETQGPLLEGEVARARKWGVDLGSELVAPTVTSDAQR
jgi:hypothetical protein